MTPLRLRSLAILCAMLGALAFPSIAAQADAPAPLLKTGQPVSWWFAFKLNSLFPGCDGGAERVCLFGGKVQSYAKTQKAGAKTKPANWGQQFVYASSADSTLQKGNGCAGDSVNDPLGATFDEIYNGSLFYVLWNDQFYDDPKIAGCKSACGAPWGHSKGALAWDADGNGLVIQVTTPSWPASGNAAHPRKKDGNTLGCVKDNDVLVSQHFFALQLSKDDVLKVLAALENASVVTSPTASGTHAAPDAQIVNNGGPDDIQKAVARLGHKTTGTVATMETLSSGVTLISKPSNLHVPPWQMVSSLLDGVPLRTATWWATPYIPTTTASTRMACWDKSLKTKPGAVQIATTGQWDGTAFGLTGGSGPNFNHAKIGVSTSEDTPYVIFGDMNQQGDATIATPKDCARSQNGRGGLFYVVKDKTLAASVSSLLKGKSASTTLPRKKKV